MAQDALLTTEALARVQADTKRSIERLQTSEHKGAATKQLLDELNLLSKEVDTQKPDQARSRELIALMDAKSEALRKLHETDRQDLNEVMGGVRLVISELNGRFAALDVFDAEEQKLIDDAQATLTAAEQELTVAKDATFFSGSKQEKANAHIADAKTALGVAKAEAERLKRLRMANESLESILQSIEAQVATAKQILEDDLASNKADIGLVRGRVGEASVIQKAAAADVERFTDEITRIEEGIELKKAEKETHVPNSPESIEVQSQIETLDQQLRDKQGERNAATSVLQVKERALLRLVQHDRTQSTLHSNHLVMIRTLIAEAEEQSAEFRSRLGALQRSANQDAGAVLLDTVTDVQLQGTKQMVEVAANSQNIRRRMAEKHPGAMKAILDVTGQGEKHEADIKAFDEGVVAELRRRYANMPHEVPASGAD